MAIIIFNQSICSICEKELQEREQVFSFPVFTQNTKDPYYFFNDSTFHTKCLINDNLGKKAIAFSKEFFFATDPKNRKCIVGGNKIKKIEDYIFIDLLTSDETQDLFKYKFITLDVNNLTNWDDRCDFILTAQKFLKENKWGDLTNFRYLENLIRKLSMT